MTVQRLWSNGTWYDEDELARFMTRLLDREPINARFQWRAEMATSEEIMAYLESGHEIQYGTDWYEIVRGKPAPRPVKRIEAIKCNCGHTVARSLVMNASRGSSCPDCYDRMSE